MILESVKKIVIPFILEFKTHSDFKFLKLFFAEFKPRFLYSAVNLVFLEFQVQLTCESTQLFVHLLNNPRFNSPIGSEQCLVRIEMLFRLQHGCDNFLVHAIALVLLGESFHEMEILSDAFPHRGAVSRLFLAHFQPTGDVVRIGDALDLYCLIGIDALGSVAMESEVTRIRLFCLPGEVQVSPPLIRLFARVYFVFDEDVFLLPIGNENINATAALSILPGNCVFLTHPRRSVNNVVFFFYIQFLQKESKKPVSITMGALGIEQLSQYRCVRSGFEVTDPENLQEVESLSGAGHQLRLVQNHRSRLVQEIKDF